MSENLNFNPLENKVPEGCKRGAPDFLDDTLEFPIEVVYRDDHYVGVFKPAGLMVHRGPRSLPTEPVLLQALRDQLNQFLYPIHRLDRPTAGLILFGLSREAASRMGSLFAERRIQKHYQALVRGHLHGEVTVDRPLMDREEPWLDPLPARRERQEQEEEQELPSQSAITHFRCLEHYEVDWPTSEFPTSRFTLLEIEPHTGRWHQIRRHLNHLAHPVIGDHRHGDHRWNQRFFEKTGIYRMLLTAMRLDFRHPFTQELVSLWVPRGESFDGALAKLRGPW
jgi:tRNA pseudouridine65 synthase